jgi:outer membrane protein OmpA-like peptidoglycan-associated protein
LGEKDALKALLKKLESGASITITGYAKSDPALARKRAQIVEEFLKSKGIFHFTLKIVTSTSANRVVVTTVKQ